MIEGMPQELDIAGDTQITINVCSDGAQQPCQGPGGVPQNETGECQFGQETCVGGVWDGICVGWVDASPEVCDGLDTDCDAVLDGSEGLTQQCGPQNETGLCQYGSQGCLDTGQWDVCSGQIDSAKEICPWTLADENCNGNDQEYKGDVDCTGCVDISDLVTVAGEFGTAGVSGDLNGDSLVDIFDLVMVGSAMGIGYEGSPC
jgi:hypothetical protein